jgi:hypothetical protein
MATIAFSKFGAFQKTMMIAAGCQARPFPLSEAFEDVRFVLGIKNLDC